MDIRILWIYMVSIYGEQDCCWWESGESYKVEVRVWMNMIYNIEIAL